MKFNIERKVNVTAVVIILLMAAVGAQSYVSIERLMENTRRVTESRVVRRKAQAVLMTMLNLETGSRGYVITGSNLYLGPYRDALTKCDEQMAELSLAIGDLPEQRKRFTELAALVPAILAIEKEHIDLRQNQGLEAAVNAFKPGIGIQTMDRIREVVGAIVAAQDELLRQLNQAGTLDGQQASWTIGIGGIVGFLFVVASCLLVHRDVAKNRKSEDAIASLNTTLCNQNEQLKAINSEMEAFSYSVSHDLRAPLRSLDGFSQALLEDYPDKLDEEGQDHLRRIRAASQRMGRLIDDLLNLSRLTRIEMKREPVDLSKMATAILADLAASETERQVGVIVAEGLTTYADPRLLQIALTNLLNNAWKFTSKVPQARIEFGSEDKNDEKIFFVRDNGIGFDMTYAGKLFGAFQRLHEMNEFPGTGIGLATVQRVMLRHGGRAWGEGALNKGATFRFSIPGSASSLNVG